MTGRISSPWLSVIALLTIVPLSVTAQERESAVQADPGVGGPQTIGAQLEIDNTPGDYRFPVVVFADWFKQKQRINDEYGIGYNINYTTLATWARARKFDLSLRLLCIVDVTQVVSRDDWKVEFVERIQDTG